MQKISRRLLVKIIIACLLAGAGIVIGQIWFDFISDSTFCKILVTLSIVGLVAGILLALTTDLSDDKNLKDKGYLD